MKENKRSSQFNPDCPVVSIWTVLVLLIFCTVGPSNQLLSQVLTNQSIELQAKTGISDNLSTSRIEIKKSQDHSRSFFESLLQDDILNMTLKTDQQKLLQDKKKKEYQQGWLTYLDKDGKTITNDIQVKTRGNMRLNHCYNPPLKIKLSTSPSTLRLVLGCDTDNQYQQLLLREYIGYKLYNVVSDYSFRVQLINLHLQDTEGEKQAHDTYGLIIEDEEEVVARMGGHIPEPKAISPKDLNRQVYQILSLFQYIVGNTDWIATSQHNIKLMTTDNEDGIIAIPYDFDHAGLVNSPYAQPNNQLPISSVQERLFIGDCDYEGYKEVVRLVLDSKDDLLGVLTNCAQLNDASKAYAMKYLQKSFEILEDRKILEKEIKRGCDWAQ